MRNILEIKNLHAYFYTPDSIVKAVDGVNLFAREGEVLGLAGESGCGKTVTAQAVMRLIPSPGRIVQGEIIFEGQNLGGLSQEQMRQLRGNKISLIFQEPQAALNPLYPIGYQISEKILCHRKSFTRRQVRELTLGLLEKVGIANPRIRYKDYPFNLSGGQAQRVMIAMALSCSPALLIADEPTTSLDVTIQAQIMDLFARLRKETKFTLILITHNLALCARTADRLAVMYAGRIVETASIERIFTSSLHPYTKALFSSIPRGESYKNRLKVIEGSVVDSAFKPTGCYFHPRCPTKKEICVNAYPEFKEVHHGHWVSCFMVR